MNSQILKIRFSSLLKLELPVLANSVIEIVERHNPETLKVKELFDELVEQKPHINKLEVDFGPHPRTKDMDDLRRRLRAFASGIRNQMITIKNGKVDGMQASLKVVQPVVDRYLYLLSKETNKVTEGKVAQFFEQIDTDEELESAFSTLNMTANLNELRNVSSNLVEQYNKRRLSFSYRTKLKTSTIVSIIRTAMENLFSDIQLAQVKNKDLDYTPLIDELNVELAYFDRSINARASYNKKKAEGVVDDNNVVIDDESEEPVTTATSNMRIYPMNEEAEETLGDLDEVVDKKKTVAVSSITTQLPIVPTKA